MTHIATLRHPLPNTIPAGNTEDLSVVGGWTETPSAALLFMSDSNVSEGSGNIWSSWGIGFADGTNQRAGWMSSQHNVGTTSTDRAAGSDCILVKVSPSTGTIVGKLSFVQWLPGGMRIRHDDPWPGNNKYLGVMFFTDCRAAVGDLSLNTTVGGQTVVSGLGFKPNLIFFNSYNRGFTNPAAVSTTANYSFGVAIPGKQFHYAYFDDDGVSTVAKGAYASEAFVQSHIDQSSWVRGMNMVSFDNDGFTVSRRIGSDTTGWTVGYMALQLQCPMDISVMDAPGSTGPQKLVAPFEPQAIINLSPVLQVQDTWIGGFNQDAGACGLGLWTKYQEAAMSYCGENNVPTSNERSYAAARLAYVEDKNGNPVIVSQTSNPYQDGIDINWVTVPAGNRPQYYLSFGQPYRPGLQLGCNF